MKINVIPDGKLTEFECTTRASVLSAGLGPPGKHRPVPTSVAIKVKNLKYDFVALGPVVGLRRASGQRRKILKLEKHPNHAIDLLVIKMNKIQKIIFWQIRSQPES